VASAPGQFSQERSLVDVIALVSDNATLEMTWNFNTGSAPCAQPQGAIHFGTSQERTDPQPKFNGETGPHEITDGAGAAAIDP